MHFFTVENVGWRALPERFGHWNSVWKRFDRLSKAGVFEAFFDTLAEMSASAHLIQLGEDGNHPICQATDHNSGTLRCRLGRAATTPSCSGPYLTAVHRP